MEGRLIRENNEYGYEYDSEYEKKSTIFNKEVFVYKKYSNEITRNRFIKKYGEPEIEIENNLIFSFVKSDFLEGML